MATQYDTLIAELQAQQEKANLANQTRYDQMLAIYDETINRYQPGGSFEQKFLQQLGKQKEQFIGREFQDMISSGLAGTTTKATSGGKFEEQIGAPARLNLEDIQMQRLTQAQMGKAGVIERVEDTGPGYDLIAQLAMQAGQGSGNTYYTGQPGSTGGGGSSSGQSLNDWMNSTFGSPSTGGGGVPAATTPTSTWSRKQATEDWEKKYADTPDWTPAPFTSAEKSGATASSSGGYSMEGMLGDASALSTMEEVLKKYPNAVQTSSRSWGVPK